MIIIVSNNQSSNVRGFSLFNHGSHISDCGALTIADGTPVYTSGTTFGSVASFTCNPGYTPSVVVTRTCEAGGSWSNASPFCNPVGELYRLSACTRVCVAPVNEYIFLAYIAGCLR